MNMHSKLLENSKDKFLKDFYLIGAIFAYMNGVLQSFLVSCDFCPYFNVSKSWEEWGESEFGLMELFIHSHHICFPS